MVPRILIDLDVFTKAIWDKEKEAGEFLASCEKKFNVVTPVIILFHIIRNWKYQKLVDAIFRQIDKTTSAYVGHFQTDLECVRIANMRIRALSRKMSRDLNIPVDDGKMVVYSSLNGVRYLVTYNRKHLKNKEVEITNFLRKHNMPLVEIALPSMF